MHDGTAAQLHFERASQDGDARDRRMLQSFLRDPTDLNVGFLALIDYMRCDEGDVKEMDYGSRREARHLHCMSVGVLMMTRLIIQLISKQDLCFSSSLGSSRSLSISLVYTLSKCLNMIR